MPTLLSGSYVHAPHGLFAGMFFPRQHLIDAELFGVRVLAQGSLAPEDSFNVSIVCKSDVNSASSTLPVAGSPTA